MRDALLCCDRKQPRTIDLLFTNKKDIITNNWIEIYQHHRLVVNRRMYGVGRASVRAVSVADQKYVFMRCYNAIWCDASAKAANAMCILTYIFYFARCVLLWTEQRQPMPMDEWKLSESQSCIRNLCVRWKVTFYRSVFILRRSACVVSWEFFCFVLAGGAANCAYRMNELRCLCPYLSPIDDEVFGRTRSASLSMQARLPPNNDTAIHVHRSLTRSILTQKSIKFLLCTTNVCLLHAGSTKQMKTYIFCN